MDPTFAAYKIGFASFAYQFTHNVDEAFHIVAISMGPYMGYVVSEDSLAAIFKEIEKRGKEYEAAAKP